MPPQLTKPNDYKSLVKQIQTELSALDFFVKRRTAEGYWKIGKYIHEHIYQQKDRAGLGEKLCQKLAEDVNRDATTLWRMVKFYRTYPVLAARQELSWTHYKTLITVKDKDERKKLEKQIIEKDWDTDKLQEYLNTKRELGAPKGAPIPVLTFTRGVEGVFEIVKDEAGELVIDFGFRVTRKIPSLNGSKIREGDFVKQDGSKVVISKDDLYTYVAQVTKVVDGDTLIVKIRIDDNVSIRQKLRLKGIDCPEMDTQEGRRAKTYVLARTKPGDSITIKTYKDRTDKYDRYLADIFYGDLNKEIYLNQLLLDEDLAERMG